MKISEQCPICFDYKKNPLSFPQCNHEFCRDCLRKQIEYKINKSQFQFLVCPLCEIQLDNIVWIKQIVDEKQYVNYSHQLLKYQSIKNNEIYIKCANQACLFEFIIWKDADYYRCPECKFEFCRKCKKEHKNEQHCEKVEKLDSYIKMKQDHQLSKCPKCGFGVLKTAGCNFMTCNCGTHFCYKCDKQLQKEDHFKHYQQNNPSFNCNAQKKSNFKLLGIQDLKVCFVCNARLTCFIDKLIYQCFSQNCNGLFYCIKCNTKMNEDDIERHLNLDVCVFQD